MLAEFAWRLAVALPLVCLLAAALLLAAKRGWLPLPLHIGPRRAAPARPPGEAALAIASSVAVSPGVRLAHVRFLDRDLLVGVAGQSFTLLADANEPPTPREEGR